MVRTTSTVTGEQYREAIVELWGADAPVAAASRAIGVTRRQIQKLCRMTRVPLVYVRALNDAAAEVAAQQEDVSA